MLESIIRVIQGVEAPIRMGMDLDVIRRDGVEPKQDDDVTCSEWLLVQCSFLQTLGLEIDRNPKKLRYCDFAIVADHREVWPKECRELLAIFVVFPGKMY